MLQPLKKKRRTRRRKKEAKDCHYVAVVVVGIQLPDKSVVAVFALLLLLHLLVLDS